MKYRILVVDDDEAHRRFLRGVLEGEGFAVESGGSGADALASAAKARPDLIGGQVRGGSGAPLSRG